MLFAETVDHNNKSRCRPTCPPLHASALHATPRPKEATTNSHARARHHDDKERRRRVQRRTTRRSQQYRHDIACRCMCWVDDVGAQLSCTSPALCAEPVISTSVHPPLLLRNHPFDAVEQCLACLVCAALPPPPPPATATQDTDVQCSQR